MTMGLQWSDEGVYDILYVEAVDRANANRGSGSNIRSSQRHKASSEQQTKKKRPSEPMAIKNKASTATREPATYNKNLLTVGSPPRHVSSYNDIITCVSKSPVESECPLSASVPIPTSNGLAHRFAESPDEAFHPSSLPSGGGVPSQVNELEEELEEVRAQLRHYKELAESMQSNEKMLRRRLSEQAQKQLQRGTLFEDLSLGVNRPTEIVRRYGDMYSELRVETLDALDELPEMSEYDDLKGKLLFSVVVLSFRAAHHHLRHVKHKLRHYLCLPDSRKQELEGISKELDNMITDYLRKTVTQYNLTGCINEVCNQVWSTLYDYPSLKECQALRDYIEECVRLAWSATVQNPPLVLEYDTKEYNPDMHTRFHTSDPDSVEISSVLWPCMLEGERGPCLQKGVVIT